jgi:hypothetical protein
VFKPSKELRALVADEEPLSSRDERPYPAA